MQDTPDHVPDEPQHLKATLKAIADRAIAREPQQTEMPRIRAGDQGVDHAALAKTKIVTLRLQSKGRDTVAHETNLARAAVWKTRGAEQPPGQLVTISVLYGRPFQQREGKPLTVADQRWFAELTTRWVRGSCPADLRIPFSLRDAAEVLGYSSGGGRQLELVRASLLRLRSATFESVIRHPDGREETTIWGLLERARITQPRTGPARGWVEFNRQVAELLQEGSVTYLHAPTWDRMRNRDELAARLWVFLEAEELPTLGRRYNVFSAPPGEDPKPRSVPAIAELMGLKERAIRRKTVDRIRQGARAIEQLDPRYVAEVVRGAQTGMWRLEVRRRHLVLSPACDP